MKSVLVSFQPRGGEYEYLIPDDLFDYVTVGSMVITPPRPTGRQHSVAVVTQVRAEATAQATAVIEGIVAGQDECKLFKNKVVDVAALKVMRERRDKLIKEIIAMENKLKET